MRSLPSFLWSRLTGHFPAPIAARSPRSSSDSRPGPSLHSPLHSLSGFAEGANQVGGSKPGGRVQKGTQQGVHKHLLKSSLPGVFSYLLQPLQGVTSPSSLLRASTHRPCWIPVPWNTPCSQLVPAGTLGLAQVNISGQCLECCPSAHLPHDAFLMPGSMPQSSWRLSLGHFLN